MKQIFAILLLSFGVYSFAFGIYLTTKSLENERKDKLRSIVYPDRSPGPALTAGQGVQYPIGVFLLSASGTTFGLWGGIHLLIHKPAAKKSRK